MTTDNKDTTRREPVGLQLAVKLAEDITSTCQLMDIEERLAPAAREAWYAVRVGDTRQDAASRALIYVRLQVLLASPDALMLVVQRLRDRLVAADPMVALMAAHGLVSVAADEARHG